MRPLFWHITMLSKLCDAIVKSQSFFCIIFCFNSIERLIMSRSAFILLPSYCIVLDWNTKSASINIFLCIKWLMVFSQLVLSELLRENKRMLDRSIREIERERQGLQAQEKKLITEIKKTAKEGQMV